MADAAGAALLAPFATIIGVWLFTVVSPGPNFLATSQAALNHSRRAGLAVAAGIAVGTTVWSTASLLGLGILFHTTAWLYHAVRVLGAAYLIYLGLRAILTAHRMPSDATLRSGPMPPGKAFRRGLLIDLSNPKAAAFFTSLFAVAVPPDAPVWFSAAAIATVVAIAWSWYSAVACAVTVGPVARLYDRSRRLVAYATGALFVGLGARLAADR